MERLVLVIERLLMLSVYNLYIVAVFMSILSNIKKYDKNRAEDSLWYLFSRYFIIAFHLTILFGLLINLWVNLRSLYFI